MTSMDQKQLERFVDVVESGSLSRTARRLNTSQPALSKSLRLLEEQLGVRLLERGPRGVRLTKFGDAFYRRACSITSEFRRARDDIEDMKGSTAGTVSLGVTPGPGILDKVIPQAVARVARKRPALQFRVRSGTLSELLIELHRGDLDLLFTVLDERTEGADLKTRLVFEDHFVLVVGKRHPLLARETITLNDLANFRWALLEDAMPLWHVITELAQRDKIPIQGSPIKSNSVVFVRTIVSKNDFVGVLPSYAAALGTEAGDLGCIPLERLSEHGMLPRLVRPMGLVHPAEIELTRGSHALLRSIITVCHELNFIRPKVPADDITPPKQGEAQHSDAVGRPRR
jgi:DNA-binding transcriptional LysR family regulator